VLAPGDYADVVAFDPATFADRSTYEQPTLPAVGVRYLLVNGVLTIDGGTYTGATGGRALRRER
jgi:N-acyl-D-amino-acid deacylase